MTGNLKTYLTFVCLTALFVGHQIAMCAPQVRQKIAMDSSNVKLDEFDVHKDLKLTLFAAEPQLVNPTNIDIDHLGRVWVCEAVNYRHFANRDQPERKEGDRIIVLEDSDGDGSADTSTTFYQDPSINSPHGICVLGNKVIVSAGDSVYVLTDLNGDLVADKKDVLFTGIQGVQHDHGIHAFVFGPDGKLYFNFGNEGKRLRDKNGKPIVDMAGNVVEIKRPYQNGMVFRCDMDGGNVETLAWNFRNNWEVCVDSFGRMWQSDNDDDGNRATRINFVVPYGNYGFSDEMTGAGWRAERIGQAAEIPERHWHLNDPGVVPNLLITGAGSPTGICVYEGARLPKIFQGQVIHCDAGPNVVRCYPVQTNGAGFDASSVTLMDGSQKSQWFRPSDVCVAPDGTLLVADWFDPGVGGHRMRDIKGGRLYRLAPKTANAGFDPVVFDLETVAGATTALTSPNQALRYMAWQSLSKHGDTAIESLIEMAKVGNPRFRARAFWFLAKNHASDQRVQKLLVDTANDVEPDLRATIVRIACQLENDFAQTLWSEINLDDESAAVRRELLIAMRQPGGMPFSPHAWAQLAKKYQTGDRWYLEAIGIAADGRWDACLAELKKSAGWNLHNKESQDIVWRSRGSQTAQMLAKIISLESVAVQDVPRYFRSLDFVPKDSVDAVARSMAFEHRHADPTKAQLVTRESLSRMRGGQLSESEKSQLQKLVADLRGSQEYVRLVKQFSLDGESGNLLKMSMEFANDQLGVDAMTVLVDLGQRQLLLDRLISLAKKEDASEYLALLKLIASTGRRPAADLLAELVKTDSMLLERRRQAVSAMGTIHRGSVQLMEWAEANEFESELELAFIAALFNSSSDSIRQRARKRFPDVGQNDARPLPVISSLMKLRGDFVRGEKVFKTENAQCSKCHLVKGEGTSVGPDLSEIGSKLAKSAMFESILYPSAGISHGYENWSVMTIDGQLLNGLIIAETDTEIVVQDKEGIKRTVNKEDIDERKRLTRSLMPDGLHNELNDQQIADLVSYMGRLTKDWKNEAAFVSELVTGRDSSQRVDVDVDITGAKYLYLIVTDGGDGYSCDWACWAEPTLIDEAGTETLLSELKWSTARAGWGQVRENRNCNGGPIKIDGQEYDTGIGTHAPSIIRFDLPAEHNFVRFKSIAGIDDGGAKQGGGANSSIRLFVFTKPPPHNVLGNTD